MKHEIEIVDAVLRDASFVCANLRPRDRHEAFCQLPEGATSLQLAEWLLASPTALVARVNGQPVMFFGLAPVNAVAYSAFALGTRDAWRAIPAVTAKLNDEVIPFLIDNQGLRIVEARSWVAHTEAHRWMLGMGAKQVGTAFPYGRDGSMFYLFRWTVADYRAIRAKQLEKADPCAS